MNVPSRTWPTAAPSSKTLICTMVACATLLAQDSPVPNPISIAPQVPEKAPAEAAKSDETIRANVHLVLVPVTVTDAKGHFVDGLSAPDFVLYDDGTMQSQLQVDSSDTVLAPVALVIAIQASGISQAALEKIHKIGSMFAPLIAGEKGQAAVIAYDDEVRTIQNFTRDSSDIERAFESINGRTLKAGHLFDAVIAGSKMLETAPESYRRMLLILGESRDRGSKAKLDEALEAAQKANVTMYPVTYSAQSTAWTASAAVPLPMDPDYSGAVVEVLRMTTRNAADEFARWTGGRHFAFSRLEGLQQAISRLSNEVHSQYLLSFVPAESPNLGSHRLLVQVHRPRGAVVRARPVYWP